MTVHYSDDAVTLHHGDCLDVLRQLPDCSVDTVVTDPPYGLEFMGREWDGADGFRRSLNPADVGRDNAFGRASRTSPEYRAGSVFQQWCEAWSTECLRVLKPGGHLLAFGGTRTYHRLTCGIEDAGFEIRDSIVWVYASGFPKSLDVPKAVLREAMPRTRTAAHLEGLDGYAAMALAERAAFDLLMDGARQGWGTALKPAQEPIVVARKPLAGTVAANVLAWGTGALNIDACRVEGRERTEYGLAVATRSQGAVYGAPSATADFDASKGRWPSNLVLSHASTPDGADLCGDGCVDGCPVRELDQQSGFTVSPSSTGRGAGGQHGAYSPIAAQGKVSAPGDSGGASRFFPTFRYEPKAPTAERPRIGGGKAPGIAANRCKTCGRQEPGMTGSPCTCPAPEWEKRTGPTDVIAHPTVKPLDLMRWLVRLVTPPGGLVLEPFAGSGTTAEACVLEGMRCVAIEREAAYLPLIVARLSKPLQPGLFG